MRPIVRLLPLLLVLLVGGCGESVSSGGGADPAKLAPAGAAFYLEMVVRPEGDQRERMEALAAKILRTDDPGAKIKSLIDEQISEEDKDASYDKDIAPWLGERVGASFSDLAGDDPRFAVVLQSKDEEAAKKEVLAQSIRDRSRKRTYKDFEYFVDTDDQVSGAVKDAVVIASDEGQFKAAVDARDKGSLSESKAYKDAIAELPDDRVGTIFVDTKKIIDAGLAQTDPSEAALAKPLFGELQPIAAAVLAEENSIAIETSTKTPKKGSSPISALGLGSVGSTDLVREVPAGSWAAMGIPDLGELAKTTVSTLAGAFGGAVLGGQLEQELGIDLENDVYAWIGDVAVFVRGQTVNELDGALVIEVRDEAKAQAAIPKLIGLARQQAGAPFEPVKVPGASVAFAAPLPDAPVGPLIVALAGDRAVIAIGEAAASDALDPSETIEDSGLYTRAKDAADGIEPSVILDGKTIVGMISSVVPEDEEGFLQAKPYLDLIDLIAAGSEADGDRTRSRFALTLR